MANTTRNAALSDLAAEVFRLTARLNQLADRLTRGSGLTSARWQTLATLAAAGEPLTVAEIARRMGLQRQSVQRTADALADLGFIEYRDNPRHRRAKLAALTTRGAAVLDTMQRLRESWAHSVDPSIDQAELQAATTTLSRLRAELDNPQ